MDTVKYNEDELLKEVSEYISNTYKGHYSAGNVQTLDLIDACGDAEAFCNNLATWADIIRRTFKDGGIDEVISTRRLVHIIRAFAIWNDRMKAIKVCVNRFDDETKQSFIDLYDKIDADVVTEESEDE